VVVLTNLDAGHSCRGLIAHVVASADIRPQACISNSVDLIAGITRSIERVERVEIASLSSYHSHVIMTMYPDPEVTL
jgi:hypothetical protein